MTSPFAIFTVKVFPFTDELCVQGVMLRTPDEAWRFLMEQAQGGRLGQITAREGSGAGAVYITPREIREFLARGGQVSVAPQGPGLSTLKARSDAEELGL